MSTPKVNLIVSQNADGEGRCCGEGRGRHLRVAHQEAVGARGGGRPGREGAGGSEVRAQ